MSTSNLDIIGSGAYFPITLASVEATDSNGDPTGEILTSWQPLSGDPDLIKQNLTSILTYQIGQRFREEDFGCRVWECLEEPNKDITAFLVRKYIAESISSWEPRIEALEVTSYIDSEALYVQVKFKLNSSNIIDDLEFSYNPTNNTTNVY